MRAVRAQAEHYIYIENQYFLGSSHCWEADRHAGATHLVPIEIALKIVSKINDGERFMAYIVIPLFPEGASGRLCPHRQCAKAAVESQLLQHGAHRCYPADWLEKVSEGVSVRCAMSGDKKTQVLLSMQGRSLNVAGAGIPESGPCQAILHWQCNTVRMMYSIIADAIAAKGVRSLGYGT